MPDSPAIALAAERHDALAVARGICRLFARNDIWCLAEMPLRNGRRADLMGVDAKGRIVIVEIKVARADLEPGDLILFNDRGRGRVSHAGIYLGDDQFIHSSSSRSGGVRIDSLDDSYWNRSYLQAKRVLALAQVDDEQAAKRHP